MAERHTWEKARTRGSSFRCYSQAEEGSVTWGKVWVTGVVAAC